MKATTTCYEIVINYFSFFFFFAFSLVNQCGYKFSEEHSTLSCNVFNVLNLLFTSTQYKHTFFFSLYVCDMLSNLLFLFHVRNYARSMERKSARKNYIIITDIDEIILKAVFMLILPPSDGMALKFFVTLFFAKCFVC